MSPNTKEPVLTAGKMHDPAWCHYCNKNKLEPDEKYYLPNGIEVCRDCAARHSTGTSKRHVRLKKAEK